MADDDAAGDADEEQRAAELLALLERLAGASCRGCRRAICGHETVVSIALGFQDAPRCLGCLASGLARERESLRDQAMEHIFHRPCFLQGWRFASERERTSPERPHCIFRDPAGTGTRPPMSDDRPDDRPSGGREHAMEPAAKWDAGDMGCGELVLELRMRMLALAPGAVLELRATDPGAPEDIPAWCRLTGHTLVSASHPVYRIERRQGP